MYPQIAQELEKIAQEKRWAYIQQLRNPSEENNKKNIVKQVLPEIGQDSIVQTLRKLEFARPLGKIHFYLTLEDRIKSNCS